MTPRSEIQAFLAELREKLQEDLVIRDRILAETENHLGEAVEHLEASGVSPAEAERQAIGKFGTPSEIARSYAAEREKQGERSLWPLTRWRMIAAAAVLVVLGFIGSAVLERDTVEQIQITETHIQKAFTATRHFRVFDRSGVERGSGTLVQDFRSDGSVAKSSSGNISLPGHQPEPVQLKTIDDRAADVYALVLPEHHLISSHRIPRKDEPGGFLWHIAPPKHCSILLSALETDPETESNNILGYEVLRHDYGGWSNVFFEVWIAPELDCYELRSTAWRVDAETGRRHIAATNDVVTVNEGEPDGGSFALPGSYKESQPSEFGKVAEKMVGSSDWKFSQLVKLLPDHQYQHLRRSVR